MLLTANRAGAILYRFVKTFPEKVYILPANVCPVVPLILKKADVKFEFVDIHPETLCANEQLISDKVNNHKSQYGGLIFVRSYGYQYSTTNFFHRLKNINPEFKIIDDKCLCYPEFEPLPDNVDLELFSTGYAKPVELGFGGYAKIKSNSQLKEIQEPFNPEAYHKLEEKYKQALKRREILQTNNDDWLDTGELDLSDSEYFSKIKAQQNITDAHRQKINTIYESELKNDKVLGSSFNQWRYNILTSQKNTVLQNIFDAGLFASSHYKPSNILFDNDFFPVSENLSDMIINLFNDLHITEQQAHKICTIINKTLSV